MLAQFGSQINTSLDLLSAVAEFNHEHPIDYNAPMGIESFLKIW